MISKSGRKVDRKMSHISSLKTALLTGGKGEGLRTYVSDPGNPEKRPECTCLICSSFFEETIRTEKRRKKFMFMQTLSTEWKIRTTGKETDGLCRFAGNPANLLQQKSTVARYFFAAEKS